MRVEHLRMTCCFFVLLVASLMVLSLLPANQASAVPSIPEKTNTRITVNFPTPEVTEVKGYYRVLMEGLGSFGDPGEPKLPIKTVRVTIPFGSEVKGVRVSHGRKVTLDGSYCVEPAQRPIPLSSSENIEPTPPDERIYNSSFPFPARVYSDPFFQSKRGYRILILNLYPVSYVPARGELSHFEDMTVEIDFRPSDNPEAIDSYPQFGPLASGNEYKYVIITSEELKNYSGDYDWQTLCDRKESRGIATNIVTLDWIYANYDGIDDPEKIRNFIKDAYDNWSTEYVLLGGDDTIVPFRRFWVQAGGYTANMPSDMYYSCLDGTFNYDGDDRWGEPNDGPGGGEVDLYAEVYVGRAPVASGTDVSNFVRKTLAFEDLVPEEKYLAYMVGEWLGFGGVAEYAKAYKEEVRLGSDNHGYTTVGFASCDWVETDTLYEKDRPWSKYDLIDIINSGVWALNHLGHGGKQYAMKLYNSDLDSLTNTEYFFAYSQTCSAGHFDDTECWAEKVVRMGNGAAAVVMNARYGWGAFNSTDGPSQHFDREFWDAVFGENIHAMGWANADSKEDQDWYITSSSYGRWCAYELNLFGDPELHFVNLLVTVDISPSEDIGLPGTTLDYTVRISNGDREDNYTLTVSDIENWDLTLSENLLENMQPYEKREVTLSVTIPDDVDLGTEDEITVIVTSQENAEISDNAVCKARVPPRRRVEVSIVPSEKLGCPDITFEVTVKNTGIENDNYDLTIDDNADWGLRLSENLLRDMTYDENRNVTLTATIPDGTKPGTIDNITVTAISQGDPSVSDSASCLARAGIRVIEDNFERYEVGEFPSAGGWRTVWGGTGQNYVVDSVSVSGSKSFQLEGKPNWSAVIKRPFDWEEEPFVWEVGSKISYKVYVRAEDIGGSEKTSANFGFFNETASTWGKSYASVGFSDNGAICSGGKVLGSFSADTWYKVRVVLDTSTDLYDVWINGELVGEDLETQDSHEIKSFALFSDHAGIKIYYDDVRVYSVTYVPPMRIEPSDDADVYEKYPDNNYGSETSIWVSPYDSQKNRGFLKFDLSGIPGGVGIIEAKLHLNCWKKQYDDFDAACCPVADDSWSENSVTWNNQPSYDGSLFTVGITGTGWYTWDVTSFVSQEFGGDNIVSFCLKGAVEPHGGRALFDSKEWSQNHPYLEVVYGPPSGEWVDKDNTPKAGGYGEAVVGTGNRIYTIRCLYASSTPDFWRYDPTADSWTNMDVTGLPTGAFRNGTALAWDNGDYIYALGGARYSDADRRVFFRYTISTDSWTQLADTPGPQGAGDAITWSGYDNRIYAILGSSGHGTVFARYDTTNNSWGTRASPPAGTDDGCSLVWAGGTYLYALQGEYLETTPLSNFWRYDIVNDNWSSMADIHDEGGVGDGGSLLWIGNWLPEHENYIYALGGGDCKENPGHNYYRYSISNDSWEKLANIPYPVGFYNGNRLGFAAGKIYYWQGGTSGQYGGGNKFCMYELAPMIRIYPSDDSFVDETPYFPGIEGGLCNYNYGDKPSMDVDARENGNRRMFMKFDLSGIPDNALIISAKLRLWCWGHNWTTLNHEMRAVENDNWVEGTGGPMAENGITWNNQPTYGEMFDNILVDATGWWEWDITPFVQQEFAGDKIVSLCGRCAEEDSTPYTRSQTFRTKEYENQEYHPENEDLTEYIEIIYTSP